MCSTTIDGGVIRSGRSLLRHEREAMPPDPPGCLGKLGAVRSALSKVEGGRSVGQQVPMHDLRGCEAERLLKLEQWGNDT